MAKSEFINCPKCKTNEHVESQRSQYSEWVTCTKCGRRTQTVGFGFCSPLANWNNQEPQAKGYRSYFYYEGQEFDVDDKAAKMKEALDSVAPGHKDGDLYLLKMADVSFGEFAIAKRNEFGEFLDIQESAVFRGIVSCHPLNKNLLDLKEEFGL